VRGAAMALLTAIGREAERSHGLNSPMARTWPIRTMALSVLLLLLAYLLLYYI
jgi:hypothetical protein